MNKKVLKVMIALVAVFLIALYVVKIFYPQQFVMTVSNEKLIVIGQYIDSHLWLRYLCAGLTSFITYSLYCCACSRRWFLKWYEYSIIIAVIITARLINFVDTNIATALSISAFLFLPAIMNGNIKISALVYSFHCLAQCLSLSIRNLPIYLTTTNYLTVFLLGIESYLWLILFYFVFNYRKEI